MNKNQQIFSKNIALGLTLGLFISGPVLAQDDFYTRLKQIEQNIAQTEQKQKSLDKKVEEINDLQIKAFGKTQAETAVNPYDRKLDSLKKSKVEKTKDKEPLKENAPVKKEISPKETVSTQPQSQKVPAVTPQPEEKPQERTIEYPLQRQPKYRGRRPFIRGENNLVKDIVVVAKASGQEELSFAKEETTGYTGTTEENVFIFSDNLAAYCSIDTTSIDKMGECLERLLKERSTGSQSLKNQVATMVRESLYDTTSHAIADGARYKNDSAGYEKNVLIPLQEKSSKATDERADIEVLTLTDMEALKLKNKLVQIYANQLALDALKDFSTFEMNDMQITDIDEDTDKDK